MSSPDVIKGSKAPAGSHSLASSCFPSGAFKRKTSSSGCLGCAGAGDPSCGEDSNLEAKGDTLGMVSSKDGSKEGASLEELLTPTFAQGETPGCSSGLRKSKKMWPFWGLDLNRAHCDLLFTEAISQRMRVPNRLKVADSFSPVDEKPVSEDVPPSFRMHIPDRISLADVPDAGLRPILLNQQRKVPSVVVHVSPDSSAQPTRLGELRFLRVASKSSSQKCKRLGHLGSKSRRERSPGDCAQLALQSPGQCHERPDVGSLPTRSALLPLHMKTGSIYSMQNIFQTVYLLGQVLFHRVQDCLHDPVPSSFQESGPAPEGTLEEVGVAEMAAMRKQLSRISERLHMLEEQCNTWRQKETLVYSMMISACLINTWLWLRR